MNEVLKANLHKEIKKKIKTRFQSLMHTQYVKQSYLESEYEEISFLNDSEEATNKEMIAELLKEEPFVLLNKIIPYIVDRNLEVNPDVYLDTKKFREKYEFPFVSSFKAKEFSLVTYADEPTLKLFDSDGHDLSVFGEFKIELDRFNYLSGEIHTKGEFIKNTSMDIDSFEDLDKQINITVLGVLKDEWIPSWVEYLLEGCINIKYKNYKMALFNFFASLDKFIEVLNDVIFDYYIDNYKKLIKKYAYSSEEKSDISAFLKNKIKKFGKENRRIIEKLRDALKEVDIIKENQFSSLYSLIKEVEEIERIRNRIGHGEKVIQQFDIGEMLYTILTIIFSIINHADLEKNDWKGIVV